jgi:hypothetical protein
LLALKKVGAIAIYPQNKKQRLEPLGPDGHKDINIERALRLGPDTEWLAEESGPQQRVSTGKTSGP